MAIKWNGLSIEDLTHPGERLKAQLNVHEMTQKELSLRLGLSTKHINRILAGKAPITSDVAFGLSKVFPMSATFWNRLQARYDEEKTALNKDTTISEAEK